MPSSAGHIARTARNCATIFWAQLKPKFEYLRLFGAIIIDVWKQKQEQATALHEAALRRVKELQGRKQSLVEAFIYKREIDRVTYQEQLDKLNEELALRKLGSGMRGSMNWTCRPPSALENSYS